MRRHGDAPHRNVNGKDGQIVAGWNHQTARERQEWNGESSGFHRKAFTAVSSPLSLLLNMKWSTENKDNSSSLSPHWAHAGFVSGEEFEVWISVPIFLWENVSMFIFNISVITKYVCSIFLCLTFFRHFIFIIGSFTVLLYWRIRLRSVKWTTEKK